MDPELERAQTSGVDGMSMGPTSRYARVIPTAKTRTRRGVGGGGGGF